MTLRMTAPGNAHTPSSDGDEVRAFLDGEAEAFERLVDRYQRPVLGMCQRLLGRQDAGDLFQEVFLQAFRSMRSLREPEAFRTWLFRITVRKARRQQTRFRPQIGEMQEMPGPATDDPVVVEEDSLLLRSSLAELPPRQREVLLLRHYENLSYAEVASVLGIREEAARANHYQGLRKLRQRLNPGGPKS